MYVTVNHQGVPGSSDSLRYTIHVSYHTRKRLSSPNGEKSQNNPRPVLGLTLKYTTPAGKVKCLFQKIPKYFVNRYRSYNRNQKGEVS